MRAPALTDGVSVLMPAFNAEEHIAGAIASALTPSAVPVELIVADDASTDATCAVVQDIARADPRVRLLRMETNGGPSRARNAAAAAARYRWLAMLDADDRWLPGRLDRLAGVVGRTGARVVSDDIEVHGLRSERWSFGRSIGWAPALDDPLDAVLFSRRGWPVKPVFDRRLFERSGGFDERIAYGEDALLFTQWLIHGERWAVHPAAGYVYVRRKGSLTGGGGTPHQLISVLERLLREAHRLDRGDIVRALEPRLRRAHADAAYADAAQAHSWRDRTRAAFALAPHLAELGVRAAEGVARRVRTRAAGRP